MSLLLDEMRPGLHATDPETPLILMAGPLAGTSAPSSSNLAIVTLKCDTSGSVATGCSGGYWAAYLKQAGYDGVVVTGRAKKPVFLSIEDENVAICDASALWGLDTRETERLIKRSLFDQPQISVACIGPAGEALLFGASIRNDRNHGAHCGGAGAVMGSKRLKAIAVRGSKRVPIRNRVRFDAVTKVWSDAIEVESTSVGAVVRRASGPVGSACASGGQSQALLGKNLAAVSSSVQFRKRFADAAAYSWTVVPKGCFNCGTHCAYDCHVNEGEFARTTASICGCSERAGDAAAMLGIEDPSAAIALTEYFHAVGLDSAMVGVLMARAFQLFDRGLLSLEDTEGLELAAGSFDAAIELLDQIVAGRGLGRAEVGKGLRELVMNNLATPKAWLKGIVGDIKPFMIEANLESTTSRDGESKTHVLPPEQFAHCRLNDQHDRRTGAVAPLDGKMQVASLSRLYEQTLWENCLGVCLSACAGVTNIMTYSTQALRYATGWDDFSPEEAVLVGERVGALSQFVELRNQMDY